jgi:ABC-type uncharacterized transport system involved in gliding motility auxiliary subunit
MEIIGKTTAMIVAILGVLLGLASLFVYLTWPDQVWVYTTLSILSAVHLIVFFVSYFEVIRAVSRQRSTQLGANSVLMVVLFVAILIMINFIVVQHSTRRDFSIDGTYTLSPQTQDLLKGLKQEVKFSGFFAEDSPKAGPARDLFENYRHYSSKVKYEMIDPDKKPAIAKQYGITDYDTVIVETKGQSAKVTALTEQEITSALIRISREAKKQFYFIEGHGEHPLADTERGGFSTVKESLEKQGFSVKNLLLLSEKEVPEDAAVVIIGGPEKEYRPEEKEALDRYLARNGQLVVLIDPMTETTLEPFLEKWGVVLLKNIIIDPSSGIGPAVPIVSTSGYLSHPITQKFDMATFYSLARSVTFDPKKADQIRFDSILQTSPNSWATSQLTEQITIDPIRDQKGPIVLGGVFSSRQAPEEDGEEGAAQERSPGEAMRLVVIGDSDFATNGMVRAVGNGDLFQNIITWLAREDDLVSIRPRESAAGTLILSKSDQATLFYLSVLILPCAILFTGIFISRKRRRL